MGSLTLRKTITKTALAATTTLKHC